MLKRLRNYLEQTDKDWNYITPCSFFTEYFGTRKKHVVIDLRAKEEFDKFHLPGAVNIFWLDLLEDRSVSFLKHKCETGHKIFLICYVGHTSSQAMTLLKLIGIPVTSIKYGYGVSPIRGIPVAGWLSYNYPLDFS